MDCLKDVYSPNLYENIKKLALDKGYEFYIDNADNLVIHKKGNGHKVLVPIISEKEELLITSVSGKEARFVANIDIKYEDNTNVYISDNLIGHIIKNDNKPIIQTYNTMPKKGDKAYIKPHFYYKGYKLYSRNVKANIFLYIFENLIFQNYDTDKEIYFTLSFSKQSAKTLALDIKPEYIFLIFYDKHRENFKLSNGCGIVYKDGGAIIDKDITKIYLNASQGTLTQNYFGKSGSLIEYFSITVSEVRIGEIILPIKNINDICESASKTDIESALTIYKNLLTNEV